MRLIETDQLIINVHISKNKRINLIKKFKKTTYTKMGSAYGEIQKNQNNFTPEISQNIFNELKNVLKLNT